MVYKVLYQLFAFTFLHLRFSLLIDLFMFSLVSSKQIESPWAFPKSSKMKVSKFIPPRLLAATFYVRPFLPNKCLW